MRCDFARTPTACHAPRRRQLVLPPQPRALWSTCVYHMPGRGTETIFTSVEQSEVRGRPSFSNVASAKAKASCYAMTRNTSSDRPLKPNDPQEARLKLLPVDLPTLDFARRLCCSVSAVRLIEVREGEITYHPRLCERFGRGVLRRDLINP